eukprot:CAMPEP_0194299810 /NCGR_PEP_ID=MMETSP0169-20130528/60918_1 /TAXON_ID=218684 /ORGANISM="Corethron pennatum, Strain L29A3" /LENGTH=683 /DNA_ID=CAMNT_0039049925 /DNA_START=13 /DNA_END=2061 /DNA_ORIENTATION=-
MTCPCNFKSLAPLLLLLLCGFVLGTNNVTSSKKFNELSEKKNKKSKTIDSKKSKKSEKSKKSKKSPTHHEVIPTHYEVIIGGAGTAGIAVAHTLQREAGINNYAILEGKDDIGGRMKAVKFGTSEEDKNEGGFSIETGSNYISGGVLNPFYCQMMKLKRKMKGYNQEWKIRVNDESGKKIFGDFDEDWKYDWDEYGDPENAAQRMVRAYGNAGWYAKHCLQKKSGAVVSKWCNDLCNINLTQLLGDGMGIDDLKVTNRTVCNKQGEFLPGDHADMSITDIMRLGGYFAQNDANGTCVARVIEYRVIEYAWLDIEMGRAPWEVSAKHWFGGKTFSGELGEARDFLVFDDRSYLFLLKSKASRVLDTSENTDNEIVLKDDRLLLNTKITKIYWDPDGETNVTVTCCNTKKVNEYSFPCTDDSRYNVTTTDFVSTFSMGVLKNSLELELSSSSLNSDDIAPMFYPPLSSVGLIKNNLDNADMGSLIKVFMQFKCKFWEDKELFFTPYSKDGFQCDYAPTFFSLDGKKGHKGSNILSLITSGNRAQDLSKPANQEPEMIYKQFLPVLNTHFKEGISTCLAAEGLNRTELTKEDMLDFFIPDWFNDPLVRGCWLSKPYGASAEEYAEFLTKGPRFGNLMFSGEGTCKRHAGWVHGGWFSGERSARILLKERKDGFENYDTQTLCDFTP